MSWAKLDDAMGEHRKIKRALRKSRPAVALHFLGILHCSRYLTDGFVEDEYIEEVLPARERKAALDALVEQGLWVQARGGFTIHDYLAHNPTRERVLAQRAADAARKARGRNSHANGRPGGQPPDNSGTPDGFREESDRGGSFVPSRPVPSTTPVSPHGDNNRAPSKPSGNRTRDVRAYEDAMSDWAARHFPEAKSVKAVIGAVSWMSTRDGIDEVTPAALREFAASSDTWADPLGLSSKEAA